MPNTKRQTSADNLNDLIVQLGGTPKYSGTKADLLDIVEKLVQGGGQTGAEVRAAVDEILPGLLDEQLPPLIAEALGDAEVTDDDLDDVFGA